MEENKKERMDLKYFEPVKIDIIWGIVLFFVTAHLSGVYGLYLIFTSAKLYTILFSKYLSTACVYIFLFNFNFKLKNCHTINKIIIEKFTLHNISTLKVYVYKNLLISNKLTFFFEILHHNAIEIITNIIIFFSALFLWIISGLGVTAGLHRLWSHKSYKAKWPLRFILMLMSTIAFEVFNIFKMKIIIIII